MNPKPSTPSQTVKTCKDCRSKPGTVRCRCSNHCMLCADCAQKTIVRATNNNWYKQYQMWCDTCIWFDIG